MHKPSKNMQVWIMRVLVSVVIIMSLLWGLTAEMYRRDLDRNMIRLKNLQKQITIQGSTEKKQ